MLGDGLQTLLDASNSPGASCCGPAAVHSQASKTAVDVPRPFQKAVGHAQDARGRPRRVCDALGSPRTSPASGTRLPNALGSPQMPLDRFGRFWVVFGRALKPLRETTASIPSTPAQRLWSSLRPYNPHAVLGRMGQKETVGKRVASVAKAYTHQEAVDRRTTDFRCPTPKCLRTQPDERKGLGGVREAVTINFTSYPLLDSGIAERHGRLARRDVMWVSCVTSLSRWHHHNAQGGYYSNLLSTSIAMPVTVLLT